MQRQGNTLLLNPTEYEAAKTLGLKDWDMPLSKNQWSRQLVFDNQRQADYWEKTILDAVQSGWQPDA